MANLSGTNVAAKLVPFTTEDTYPTHDSKYGYGGWHQVADIAERNAIPMARLADGTACFVRSTNTTYIYNLATGIWSPIEASNGILGVDVDNVPVPVVNNVAKVDITSKQNVISDLTTIRSGAAAGATALQQSDIVNSVTSTETDKALAAGIGKELQDQISVLKARGRFLSVWDCVTGLPASDPTEDPYQYKSGDYYIISRVAGGSEGPNYKPSGTEYRKRVPSTTEETEQVRVNGSYYFDGTQWITTSGIEQSVYFGSIAGNATDNASIASELDNKVNKNSPITAATHTKITYDAKGLVTHGTDLAASDIPNISADKITSGQLPDSRIESAASWNAKQDPLPNPVVDRYLHVNNAGQLEWAQPSGGVSDVRTGQDPSSSIVVNNIAYIPWSQKQDALPSPTAQNRFLHYNNNAYQWSQALRPNDNITLLTNNAGYTTNTGTVTQVRGENGLTGTVTTSGALSLATSGVTPGNYEKVTVDAYGRVTSGAGLSSGDIPSIPVERISDVTASAEEINKLDGATVSTAEINALSGVSTSETIQQQINAKSTVVGNPAGTSTATLDKITINGTVYDVGGGVVQDVKVDANSILDSEGVATIHSSTSHPYSASNPFATIDDVSAGGGVSSITAGTGLTGGTITSTGTIAVDTTVIATKQDLTGKQDTIDSTHKLSADLVDDSSATNKFVTAGDKTTWNNKQSALTVNPPTTTDELSGLTINGVSYEITGGGLVDDVFVNDVSVVENKYAYVDLKSINGNQITGTGDLTVSGTIEWEPMWDTNPMTSTEATAAGYTWY